MKVFLVILSILFLMLPPTLYGQKYGDLWQLYSDGDFQRVIELTKVELIG